MKWTVGRKMGVIFSILMAVILIISIVGGFSTYKLNESASENNEEIIPKMQIASDLKAQTRDVLALVQRHILSKDRSFEEKYEDEISKTVDQVDQMFLEYQGMADSAKEKELIGNALSVWDDFKSQTELIVDNSGQDHDELAKQQNYKAVELLDSLGEPIEQLSTMHKKEAAAAADEGNVIYRTVLIVLTIATIGGLLISIWMVRLVQRTIQKPLVELSNKFQQMAEGDLTVKPASVRTQDEIGLLGDNFNQMLTQLRTLVTSLHEHIDTVAATSVELLTSADETSSASEQIADSISSVSEDASQQKENARTSHVIIEEMAQGMDQAASSVQQVSELSASASEYTVSGSKTMQETISKMSDVKSSAESTAAVVRSLSSKSKEISQIVSLITNIADQTNLLALNAAIEAARAGEQGKGFAVVAGEVRNLAEESGNAANHISELIDSIQKEISGAIDSMEESNKLVDEGLQMMEESGSRFYEISEKVHEVSREAVEISAITEQINASTQNVKNLVDDFVKMSENTDEQSQSVAAAVEEQNATMHEMASGSAKLRDMAEQLQDLIERFKIK